MITPTEQSALWSQPSAAYPRSLAERPMKEWPVQERPNQRMWDHGAPALSDTELLAIILGTTGKANPVALAGELLARSGGWFGLQKLTLREIASLPGLGQTHAARIHAALEVARRLMRWDLPERMQIRSPGDAAQLLILEMGHLDHEQLRVICLDTKNRIQKIQTVYVGSLNSSMVRIGELFQEAIRLNSAAMIIVHNHPSTDPTPSPEDVLITRQIIEAGELLDIEILDHLIIGAGRWISLRERGLAFRDGKE